MKITILCLFFLIFSGCTLVKTTRCAEVTAWGFSGIEPLTGTFLSVGYVHYRRVAAPEDDKQKVECPMFNPDAPPQRSK